MVYDQIIHEKYALYHGDCMDVMGDLPDGSIDLSVYSPPFAGLYHYSSSPKDLSNCDDYDQFLEHYGLVVKELARITKPGRMSCVHCADVNSGNSGNDHLIPLSDDITDLHRDLGWKLVGRYCVWKEPLGVRNRTMAKSLAHKTIVEDSSKCSAAAADYLMVYRRAGENAEPIAHPTGLLEYAGETQIPNDLQQYKGWTGKQTENRYSHWIWRRYASAFWDDVRLNRVLPFRQAREEEDEKHVHPLQLDVIDRALVLWSNPGETVFTPFMGVGSEVYSAVRNGRRGIGSELKQSYYAQAVQNVHTALTEHEEQEAELLFDSEELA